MKVVILAGEYGTSLAEYIHNVLKPMRRNFYFLNIQIKNEIQKIFAVMF